ncbi:MAG: hypothetical protein U9Q96_00580 [Patescibacteria group bacterium]|nr:hypothetical protein [Patescibacteria group bacterium]
MNIKLFDLTYYRNALSNSYEEWKENYVSLEDIRIKLEKKYGAAKIVNAIGGYGHDMIVFSAGNNIKIRLRDTETSAHYIDECQNCPDYICQDGLCSVTLAADGNLKLCRPKGLDFQLNLLDAEGNIVSDDEIRAKLQKAITLFNQSKKKHRSFKDMVSSWRANI